MMQEIKTYQSIAQELSIQLPQGWESCEVKVEIDDELAGFHLHCFVASQKKFLELTEELDDCFRELWIASKNHGKGQWKKCKYVLMSDGNFTTVFDYDSKLSWED